MLNIVVVLGQVMLCLAGGVRAIALTVEARKARVCATFVDVGSTPVAKGKYNTTGLSISVLTKH